MATIINSYYINSFFFFRNENDIKINPSNEFNIDHGFYIGC